MIKKCLFALALAVLACAAGRPAAAEPVFLEPYGDIFAARTFLGAAGDARPKDALQGQPTSTENKTSRFVISPFFRITDIPVGHGPDIDLNLFGATLGYASTGSPGHPWSVAVSLFNTDVEVGRFDDSGFSFDVTGKLALWQSANKNYPVLSVVGRYMDMNAIGNRWDALLAMDQRVTNTLFLTANLGWAHWNFDGGGDSSAFRPGFGLTWSASPRLSLSGNYVISNDADHLQGVGGADFWSLGATYSMGRKASLRLGGGKNSTFFGNLNWKFD